MQMNNRVFKLTVIFSFFLSLALIGSTPGQAQSIEETRLISNDIATNANYGFSVSLNEGRALVGATHAVNDQSIATGRAFIFDQQADGSWLQVATLNPESHISGDEFAYSVSLSGDRALVGSRVFSGHTGAAAMFERQADGTWIRVADLISSDLSTSDEFGFSVSLLGDRALVGAIRDQGNVAETGAAYVFELQTDGSWLEVAKLFTSAGDAVDFFGHSVSLGEDRALIGAINSNGSGIGSGSAYVFDRQIDGTWIESVELFASDAANDDNFGHAVSLYGDRALIGAILEDDNGSDAGAGYVFERGSDGIWREEAKLLASDGASSDFFGWSTALDQDKALIGAFIADNGFTDAGSAYLFERQTDGAWAESAKITASDTGIEHRFGHAVSLLPNTALIGAPSPFADAPLDTGSAYLYDIGPASATMSIADITSAVIKGQGSGTVEATITVINEAGAPVANAIVSGVFSGDLTGTDTATTDASGLAVLVSDAISQRPSELGICVGTVTHTSLIYDQNANADPGFACESDGNSPPEASFSFITNLLTADFTDTSSDTDGMIVSWMWDFGDGAASTIQSPSYTYASNGTFTVSLTVTDDLDATGTVSQSVTVNDGTGGNAMGVSFISSPVIIRSQSSGTIESKVTIVDITGAPVVDATVSGIYSGDVNGIPAGVTDASGEVVLVSDAVFSRPQTIEFCVDDIIHTTLTYDPAINGEPIYACSTTTPSKHAGSLDQMSRIIEMQAEFLLMQNHPNPFNPITTISFSLPEEVYVQLTLYDMLGRQVKYLMDGVRKKGTHDVTLDASNLPSGLYLYRLETSIGSLTRRMLLLK